jgi:hypothetical protein
VAFHLDTVFRLVLGNEPVDLAAPKVDESVAALTVKPVAVGRRFPVTSGERSVIALGPVFLAVKDEGIGEAVLLKVVEGTVHGRLIAATPEGLKDSGRG